MRILICEELTNDIRLNIKEIEKLYSQLDENNYKAFFVYSFALFESTISESLRRILAAFPEKISDEKQVKIRHSDIFNNIYSPDNTLDVIINAEIRSISKGNALTLLETAQNLMAINLTFNKRKMKQITEYRNWLSHENTPSKREYLLGGRARKNDSYSLEIVIDFIAVLNTILLELLSSLNAKYEKYTKYKLIKGLWEETFDTPLLKFNNCIQIKQDIFDENKNVVSINVDHIDSVVNSISSSEKFYLSLFLQQYSGSLNDRYFKFNDIPSLVTLSSTNKVNKILYVFNIYPNLFNGIHIDGGN